MQVPVGAFRYALEVTPDPIVDERGVAAKSALSFDRQVIRISSKLSPQQRYAAFLRRWTQAIQHDCDTTDREELPIDGVCRLVAAGMLGLTPQDFARIHVYLAQGIESTAVMMLAGADAAIPVVQLGD